MDSSSPTITLAVGSTNPVKVTGSVEGARRALQVLTDFRLKVLSDGFSVDSGVPAQPCGDEQTKQGAHNRCISAFEKYREKHGCAPNYSIGLEGGIAFLNNGDLECFAWFAVYDGDKFGYSRSASFVLPKAISDLVKGGMELGDADDRVFGKTNNKQKGGTVGSLTRMAMDRSEYYSHAIVLAFIPFVSSELY